LKSAFDSATGSLLNKAALLKVLAGRPNPELSIDEYLIAAGLGKTF
jgi:hypothetical protein